MCAQPHQYIFEYQNDDRVFMVSGKRGGEGGRNDNEMVMLTGAF